MRASMGDHAAAPPMLSAIKLCPSTILLEARGVSHNGERESVRPHEATCQDTDHVAVTASTLAFQAVK
jgi:hypothetical protein